jgi:hypothetical protein
MISGPEFIYSGNDQAPNLFIQVMISGPEFIYSGNVGTHDFRSLSNLFFQDL